MIITIDGPTASGKSTVARLVAQQIGFMHINSGLLFRALAYALIKEEISFDSIATLTCDNIKALMQNHAITYTYDAQLGPKIYCDSVEITPFLKTAEIDRGASVVATQPAFRRAVLDYVRLLAHEHNVIADGRDCGTVMFPRADYKFFITASLKIRAERWRKDQERHGKHYTQDQAEQIVNERDARDSDRAIAPLKPAHDAIIVDTSSMTIQDVLNELVALIKP